MNIGELVDCYINDGYELADAIAKVSQDIVLLKISQSTLNRNVTIKEHLVKVNR